MGTCRNKRNNGTLVEQLSHARADYVIPVVKHCFGTVTVLFLTEVTGSLYLRNHVLSEKLVHLLDVLDVGRA